MVMKAAMACPSEILGWSAVLNFLAVWPWVTDLNFLGLKFLIYQGDMLIPLLGIIDGSNENAFKISMMMIIIVVVRKG